MPDSSLLIDLKNGEMQAIEEIYRRHHAPFIQWIKKMGGNIEDAEDLFQESMMILYEKLRQPDFVLRCQLGTYLFAVGRNLWHKRRAEIQRNHSSADILLEGLDGEIEEDLKSFRDKEAQFDRLEQALDQLGSPCNQLLRAFYYADKSMETIAQEAGYTNANNAKTQKYKCLMRLRKLFFSRPVLEAKPK